MELTFSLAPVVYAELYRLLYEDHAGILEARLAVLDLEAEWLRDVSDGYRSRWQELIEAQSQYQLPDSSLGLYSPEHGQLATWILAYLLPNGPSDEFSLNLRTRVAESTALAMPERAHNQPDESRAVVIAWTIGQVVGRFDQKLPVILAEAPKETNVDLAYKGLVEHLASMTESGPLPEMHGSSTIWRAAGISQGLSPRAKLNLKASLDELTSIARNVLSPSLHARLQAKWGDFVDARDAFTHLIGGGEFRSFEDAIEMARDREQVRETTLAITTFVCNQIATELNEGQGDHGRKYMVATVERELRD